MRNLPSTRTGETLREELELELASLRWTLQQAGLPLQVRNITALRVGNVEDALASLKCEHPGSALRIDGVWPLEMFNPPRASVTCLDCKNSFSAHLRIDLAEQLIALLQANGPDGGGLGALPMAGRMEAGHAD